jgi:hypothetical protein
VGWGAVFVNYRSYSLNLRTFFFLVWPLKWCVKYADFIAFGPRNTLLSRLRVAFRICFASNKSRSSKPVPRRKFTCFEFMSWPIILSILCIRYDRTSYGRFMAIRCMFKRPAFVEEPLTIGGVEGCLQRHLTF